MSISVLFYVQHLLGVGHLARASLVAKALVEEGAKVTLVTGGRAVPGFPGPGIDVVELPSVAAGPGGFGDLVDSSGKTIDEEFKQDRSRLLIDTLNACKPDVLLIEAYPFGRRQMRFELQPLLQAARAFKRRALIACSVRDILQERSDAKNQWTVNEINAAFDMVLVHADRAFASFDETFPRAADIADKLHYTGIVSAKPGDLQGQAFDVVVSAGGGVVGENLLRAAIAAKENCSLSSARWCMITGPNLDHRVVDDLVSMAGPQAAFYPSRPDFRALLAHAKLSISQAGYNTTADLLRAGCRSVLVPYASGGETEQTLRTSKLVKRGLVSAVSETDLTPENLTQAIERCMERPPIGTSHGISLQGARNAAQTLMNEAPRRAQVVAAKS